MVEWMEQTYIQHHALCCCLSAFPCVLEGDCGNPVHPSRFFHLHLITRSLSVSQAQKGLLQVRNKGVRENSTRTYTRSPSLSLLDVQENKAATERERERERELRSSNMYISHRHHADPTQTPPPYTRLHPSPLETFAITLPLPLSPDFPTTTPRVLLE